MSPSVPTIRISRANDHTLRPDGDYILYWMIAARRTRSNYALDRSLEWSAELGKPVLVFEALRCDYPWASDRFHRYVIDGMRDNARALEGTGIGYYPYLEPERGAGSGLLEALANRASVVITDDYPTFFLRRMVAAAAERLDLRVESVDGNGLLPMRAAERAYPRAYDFRRYLQRELAPHLDAPPRPVLPSFEMPRFGNVPALVRNRWPALALDTPVDLAELPIDHRVAPVDETGGATAGGRALENFLANRLPRYAERNQPEVEASSELSAYLHFGHLSAWEVFEGVTRQHDWSLDRISEVTRGHRRGWWGLPEAGESLLDQLVTWRELGYGFCHHRPDHDRFESLPEWALATLARHAGDERPYLYDLADFEHARTHDVIWNAAQTELRERGRIHNYLRMLWGKKILHWSHTPVEALDTMIELNNKYAVDGRDPNSYSGIFWVLGRFDRAWGPERPVFGKVRFMSSRNTRRKLRLDAYLRRWSREAL